MVRSFQIWCLNQFFLFPIRFGNGKIIEKNFLGFYIKNWFFGVHFRFWGIFLPFPMDVTFLWYDFFSCFLFYQELRTLKNYRAFRFSLNHEKLISLHRITFFYVKCRCSIKICSFSFFRIWSAIAQPITSDLREYCISFGVLIRLELDVQLHFHLPPRPLSMQKSTSRDQTFHRTRCNRRQMIST